MENTDSNIPNPEPSGTETNSLPEVLIDRAVLYHGSGASDIKDLGGC